MTSPLLPLYFVPAAVFLIAFWAVWQLIRMFDLSVATRRILFVGLGTIGLAPVTAPATITGVWVPNALLMLTPDFSYYLRFSRLIIPSFTVTAIVLGTFAWWRIRGDAKPKKLNWVTIAIPVVVIAAITGLYRFSFPDRGIPVWVTMQAVESVYGRDLDSVIALSAVDDPEQRRIADAELQSAFESDPAVLRVTYPGTMGFGRGAIFSYLRGESPPSVSCSSRPTADQRGLMRCTWSYDTFERLDVLRYSRSMAQGEEAGDVAIEFYFDEALDAFAR